MTDPGTAKRTKRLLIGALAFLLGLRREQECSQKRSADGPGAYPLPSLSSSIISTTVS